MNSTPGNAEPQLGAKNPHAKLGLGAPSVPPGYKQTEVGVIPEEWESVKAGDIGRFRGGNGFPLRFQGETASGYPFYKVSDMNNEGNDTFMFDSNNWISEGIRKQLGATAFPADTIIFAKVGAAVFLERKKILTKPSCIDNNLCGLVLEKSRTHVRFVHYSLLNIKFGSLVSTTALPSLSGTVLSQITFALPPLPEQRAIATALSDVDALLAALDRLIAKQRDLKQAAMQQLLTGQTRLPGFKGKWETKTLSEICWFQEGPGVRNTQFTTTGIKLLNGTNIYRGVLNLDTTTRFISEKEAYGPYSHFMADEGDIVLASSGITVDRLHEKVAFVRRENLPFCMNTSTIRFKPHGEKLCPRFLFQFLVGDKFKSQIGEVATGSAQLNFGPSHVAKVEITFPPLPEQTAIATVLSDMDAELTALEQRRHKTHALKQGMMQELLTGRARLL